MNQHSYPPSAEQQPAIAKARLLDIASIFNLVRECAWFGCFSNLYLQPRYQAGVGLQLFSVWLFGKIRLPDGAWFKADLQVLHYHSEFAGFILTRYHAASGKTREIYMCAVDAQYRGNGFGKLLIKTVLDNTPPDHLVEAACLPNASAMKNLLAGLRFQSIVPGQKDAARIAAEKFQYNKLEHF